jgi:hypothetical protein
MPTVQKPFDQFRCKFNCVQFWRVFFTCLKFKSPFPGIFSRRFPHGLVILCTGDFFLSLRQFREKHHFHEHTVHNPFDQFLCNFNFVQRYSYGGSSLHVLSFKTLTQIIFPGDSRIAWLFLVLRFVLYIHFGKNIIFKSLSFKNHLTNSVANLVLYNYGWFSLHV